MRPVLAALLPALLLAGCSRPPEPVPAASPTDSPVAVAATGTAPAPAQVLASHLQAALARVPAPACLAHDQRDWQAEAERSCRGDAGCLAREQLARVAVLEGLLPGVVLDAGVAALAPAGTARLLTVVGGSGDPARAEPLPLEPVILEGQPRETEGGYVLTGPGFDAEAWDAFEALLGDEDALRARFGDGPIVLPGLSGALPAQLLDVGDLAAIDAVAAQGGRLRVRGWAVPEPDAVPTIDGTGCVFVYALEDADAAP